MQRLDSSGNVLGSYGYDAFGVRVGTDSSTDPYCGYGAQAGYYRDSETGLSLLGHRTYNPSQGRFLNRDPISYNGGLNLYAYVGSNPLGGIDPTGHDWQTVGGIAGGLIGFAFGGPMGAAIGAGIGGGLGSYFGDGRSGERAITDGITSGAIGGTIGGAAALIGAGLGIGEAVGAGAVAASTEGENVIIPGSGGVGGGGDTLVRFCSEAEAKAVTDNQGFIPTMNFSGNWTRVFPAEQAATMGNNPFFQDPEKYGHVIEAGVGPGWGLPVEQGGAFIGRDGSGYTVAVPEINRFIQSIVTKPR